MPVLSVQHRPDGVQAQPCDPSIVVAALRRSQHSGQVHRASRPFEADPPRQGFAEEGGLPECPASTYHECQDDAGMRHDVSGSLSLL
jgi:hypothetical protein